MNDFGARPFCIGHGTAVAILHGEGVGLERGLLVESFQSVLPFSGTKVPSAFF
jgi:hypothetical protein